jgi:3-hydroxyacyl-CoA dehydrogenase
MSLFHIVKEMGMSIEEVDKLTGPVIGRPKSATFRTVDVVGLDTLVHVANGIKENCPEDESLDLFGLPDFIEHMMEHKWLGSKTKQGFYKKSVTAEGKKTNSSTQFGYSGICSFSKSKVCNTCNDQNN